MGPKRSARLAALAGAILLAVTVAGPAAARPKPPRSGPRKHQTAAASSTFAHGQLQASTVGAPGCGTNVAAEPAIHVSRANLLLLSSERGLGGGTDVWRQPNAVGGAGSSGCDPLYGGQPNAVQGVGLSGGDTDLAIAPERNANGTYTAYVASLNLGSVAVAHSTDDGKTWSNTPVQAGLPLDDREWIAAFGADTSLLSYHDIATNDIDILRSDNSGALYVQVSQAIPASDYKASYNELGNLVIDHRNTAGTVTGTLGQPGFWAYQSFVAPAKDPGASGPTGYNEAWMAVSKDGGYTWTDRPIPCSTASPDTDLDHNFPNVSVAPDGTVWAAWSDDHSVYTARSADHGATWACSPAVSTGSAQAIFPWMVATSSGVDLVYYGAPTTANQTWSAYFVQNPASTATGWGAPSAITTVHTGEVCEGGISCTSGRQLLDDFGIDTDQSGWAHVAYSHDAPDLGGSGSYTGYAVQTGGTPAGYPN